MPFPLIPIALGAGAYVLGRKVREDELRKAVSAQSKAAAGYGFGGTGRVRGRRMHAGFGAVAAPHPAAATPVVATSRSTPQSQLPAPQRTAVINAARPATTRPIVAPTGYIKPPTGQLGVGGSPFIRPPTGQVLPGGQNRARAPDGPGGRRSVRPRRRGLRWSGLRRPGVRGLDPALRVRGRWLQRHHREGGGGTHGPRQRPLADGLRARPGLRSRRV